MARELEKIEKLLGKDAEFLLGHKCATVDSGMLSLPGPDLHVIYQQRHGGRKADDVGRHVAHHRWCDAALPHRLKSQTGRHLRHALQIAQAALRNVFGGCSKGYEEELTRARTESLAEMGQRAAALGANAVWRSRAPARRPGRS